MRVLASDYRRGEAPAGEQGVLRELPWLEYTKRDSLRAPLASVKAARSARRVLADFDPELIYVWNGAQIPHSALRVLADARLPTAFRLCEHWFARLYRGDQYMRHLYPGEWGLRGVWARLMRLLNSRNSELHLDVDRPTGAAIEWVSEALRRLVIVPEGVELVMERVLHLVEAKSDRFQTLERRPAPDNEIAFVGRVCEEKGADVAYRAVAELRDRHGIDGRLILVGPPEGRYQHHLDRLGRELDVTDRVDVRGPLGADELGEVLSRAGALVIPSVWEDPFPLVCIEGAMARVPVVASEIGGIPEALHDREHALLFPAGDARACADALAETLSDREGTEARVARAFARGQEFSLDRYLKDSEQFLMDAVAAFGRAA